MTGEAHGPGANRPKSADNAIHDAEGSAVERQPRPTGVCLADVQGPPETPDGRLPGRDVLTVLEPLGQSRPVIEDATPGL